jgi:hypothetical protein
MCASCNNARSQPFDEAYDRFAEYIHQNEREVLDSASVDLRAVYGSSWKRGRDGLLRYFTKHAACRLAENDVEVPEPIRRYLDGGPEPRDTLALVFEIRADIVKLTLDHGARTLWLGDVQVTQMDSRRRALIIESHYGYRWLRVVWGVGSRLGGYPWPFRNAVQPLPQGPTAPVH